MDTEDLITILAVFLAIFVIVVGSIGLVWVVGNKSCNEVGEQMNIKIRYSIWTDCMVYDDGWIQLNRYKQFKD